MNEKIKRYIFAGAAVLLLVFVFWAGRSSGRAGLQSSISRTQELLDTALGERDRLLTISRGLITDIDGLGGQFAGFEEQLDQLNDSFQSGILRLEGSIERNQKIYNEYLGRIEELEQHSGEFGAIIESGNEFIESVEKGLPPGPD